MKIKQIFGIFTSIWIIDFILTVIALNKFGFIERNPIAGFFYSMGLFGYVFFFLLAIGFLFVISILLHKISYNKYNLNPKLSLGLGISIFCVIAFVVILNNLYWLIK